MVTSLVSSITYSVREASIDSSDTYVAFYASEPAIPWGVVWTGRFCASGAAGAVSGGGWGKTSDGVWGSP